MKKIVLLAFVLMLLSTAMIVSFVGPVKASGTIYIRNDGSIDPSTANITSVDNVTYTFTGNINDEIVVERDNIVVDGADYTLQGTRSGTGISLSGRSNITIKTMQIKTFSRGIYIYESSNNTVSGNTLTNNGDGVSLSWSSNNTVSGNNITNNNSCGIQLSESSNNTITGNNITANYHSGIMIDSASNNNYISGNNIATSEWYGIWLWHSSNTSVSGNDITANNGIGVFIRFSSNIRVSGNNITNNGDGIYLIDASSNIISGNNIAANHDCGIRLDLSKNNTFYHNNFLNTHQVINEPFTYASFWDNGYPSGGNYWSDYNGTDFFGGPYQNETGSDGIGDTSYSIPIFNMYGNISGFHYDNYPLMGMFSDFNATSEHHVQTVCNSSISDFQFNSTTISFNVSGENGTAGFCRIWFPTALMNATYKVFINGTEIPYTLLPCSNNTHSYLYFTYNHSTQEVIIIPEFPTWTPMLLILIALTAAIATHKRRLLKTLIH